MLDKAIVIAIEAMEYLRSRFPVDDPKYGEFHRSCADMTLRLNWLKKELQDIEHENKSRYGSACNCPRCDDAARADRELMETCVKTALAEDIKGDDMPTVSNPDGEMKLVYDRDAKIDTT